MFKNLIPFHCTTLCSPTMSSYDDLRTPTWLSSYTGQKAVIKPVQKKGGRYKNKWQVWVYRQKSKSPDKWFHPTIIYSDPNAHDAKLAMSKHLQIPPYYINFHYDSPPNMNYDPKKKRRTGRALLAAAAAPASHSRDKRPFDKFECLSPNGRARCHECSKLIPKSEPRIGIQKWNSRFSKWHVCYHHLGCCNDEKVKSLTLPPRGKECIALRKKGILVPFQSGVFIPPLKQDLSE